MVWVTGMFPTQRETARSKDQSGYLLSGRTWENSGDQESPRQTKPKKGPKRKVHEFRPFLCEFWCFSLGEQARFTLNFCSGMPPGKVHELAFLWFGLPGPLLRRAQSSGATRRTPTSRHRRAINRNSMGECPVKDGVGMIVHMCFVSAIF